MPGWSKYQHSMTVCFSFISLYAALADTLMGKNIGVLSWKPMWNQYPHMLDQFAQICTPKWHDEYQSPSHM